MKTTEPNQSLQTISCSVTVAAEPLCVPPHEMSDLKRKAHSHPSSSNHAFHRLYTRSRTPIGSYPLSRTVREIHQTQVRQDRRLFRGVSSRDREHPWLAARQYASVQAVRGRHRAVLLYVRQLSGRDLPPQSRWRVGSLRRQHTDLELWRRFQELSVGTSLQAPHQRRRGQCS